MVNIVGAHHRSGELLDDIVFFVGTLGRGDCRKLLTFVVTQFAGDEVQGFLPGRLNEFSVPLYEWRG